MIVLLKLSKYRSSWFIKQPYSKTILRWILRSWLCFFSLKSYHSSLDLFSFHNIQMNDVWFKRFFLSQCSWSLFASGCSSMLTRRNVFANDLGFFALNSIIAVKYHCEILRFYYSLVTWKRTFWIFDFHSSVSHFMNPVRLFAVQFCSRLKMDFCLMIILCSPTSEYYELDTRPILHIIWSALATTIYRP